MLTVLHLLTYIFCPVTEEEEDVVEEEEEDLFINPTVELEMREMLHVNLLALVIIQRINQCVSIPTQRPFCGCQFYY